MPHLVRMAAIDRMAAIEWWYGLRGVAQRADARIDVETDAALVSLEQRISLPMAVH